jgi:hypothetical protein
MIDELDYSGLTSEAKALAVQCEMREVTLIAAAVICLDRIAGRLEEVVIELEMMSACLQKSVEDRQ